MKCPDCGREMLYGRVTASGGPGLFFVPGGVDWDVAWAVNLKRKALAEKGVYVLDGPYFTRFNRTEMTACLCSYCRTVGMRY